MSPPKTDRSHGVRGTGEVSAAGRETPVRISLALLFCFCVVLAGLHTLIEGFDWWFSVSFIVLIVLGAAAGTRALSPRRWLPTLVATLALIGVLTAEFAHQGALLFAVPGLESFNRFFELLAEGAKTIQTSSVPVAMTPGILAQLSLGVGALAIAADLIAVTWRAPAIAGVPLLVVLAIPPAVGIGLSDVLVFALAVVGYLMLLRSGLRVPQQPRAVAFGALAVCLTILLPLVLPPVQESRATTSGIGGYLSGVNPVLNLGADLRRDFPRTMLSYSSRSDDPHYLRLVSLQNFTAETWGPDPVELDANNTPTLVGRPPGLADDVRTSDDTTWVNVVNLGSPWLPVPYPATRVTGLLGDWYWDAEALTFASADSTASGEKFRVESLDVQPTPAQLSAAGSSEPTGLGKYTALPAQLPDVISQTAREVTQDADGNYAKAVALQNFFRNGDFGYSESAPQDNGYDGTGMQMIAAFLNAKSGYCVHFASAMAVMARTLGIPSRVAVGFLPGEPSGDLVQGRLNYRVTTRDVHSWPELYFDGVGWIRFEPTPGRGFVPSYADEATPGVPTPPVVPTSTPTASPEPTQTPSATAAPVGQSDPSLAASGGAGTRGWLVPVLVLLGVLALLLIPAGIRAVQRAVRIRRAAGRWPVATTLWRELLQTAEDLGILVPAGATPRQAAAILSSAAALTGPASQAMDAALLTVESQSFAPQRRSRRSAGPDDLVIVLAALRSGSGPVARVMAALAPRSIWGRLGARLRVVPSARLVTRGG